MASEKTVIPKRWQIPMMALAGLVLALLLMRQCSGHRGRRPRPVAAPSATAVAIPGTATAPDTARHMSLAELVSLVAEIQATKDTQVAQVVSMPELARNPFYIPEPEPEPPAIQEEPPPVEAPGPDLALLSRTQALHSLTLAGTCKLDGRATALLNGKYLAVGCRIKGFTIKEIHEREVIVEDDYGEEVVKLKKGLEL